MLVAALALQLSFACTKTKTEAGSDAKSETAEVKDDALDLEKRRVTVNFTEEPKTMDPQKAADTIGLSILGHTNEGLTRLDPRNKEFPAQAESWEMKSPTKYVFKIRKGALWSDGKQVTAHDFVHAWQRGLDPKLASEYAFMLYVLKNAKAINEGKMPTTALASKAIDDMTLEVELERPVAYFLRLLSFPTFYPTRADFAKTHGEKFAADADKLLYNGPFVINSWKHNASMKLTRNDTYWNKANVWLNEIDMPYLIRDASSEFNMFKDGKYGLVVAISKELLLEAQKNKMQIRKYNAGAVWYLQVNTTRKITGNKNFRKALQYAMNREEYTKQVNGIPGTKPIYGIVPEYMPGVNKTYGQDFPITLKDTDLVKAKKFLEAAKKELKIEKFPTLGIMASDSETARRDMEYFQQYFKKTLGLDFKLDFQTFKVRLERTDRKDFDIVYSGWGPDYLDAMTFADLFTSWNQNNSTGWASKEYDKLIDFAMNSVNQQERLQAMSDAEKLLVEDAPIVPIYQNFRVYVQNPRLVGVIRRTVGPDPDYYYAKISEPMAKTK
jgi:oligopeptide transport system substrate-binding protein